MAIGISEISRKLSMAIEMTSPITANRQIEGLFFSIAIYNLVSKFLNRWLVYTANLAP